MRHCLTVIAGAALTASPAFVSALPHDYQATASAMIAALVAIYHLYQPVPGAEKNEGKGTN